MIFIQRPTFLQLIFLVFETWCHNTIKYSFAQRLQPHLRGYKPTPTRTHRLHHHQRYYTTLLICVPHASNARVCIMSKSTCLDPVCESNTSQHVTSRVSRTRATRRPDKRRGGWIDRPVGRPVGKNAVDRCTPAENMLGINVVLFWQTQIRQ